MTTAIKTGLLIILLTIIVPVMIGLFPVRFMRREHKSLILVWISGFVMMCALFEVVAVPSILNGTSFTLLCNIYTALLGLMTLICLAFGIGLMRDAFAYVRENPRDLVSFRGREHYLPLLAALVLIGLQLIAMTLVSYPDGDDAFYIGTSTTTLYTDSMYMYSPYNGASSPLDLRHALSPMPIFMAWLSRLTGLHVTILCHIYMGCILLVMTYGVLFVLGRSLFPDQKKNCWLFMCFVNILYLFGNISIYTPESFAFTRTWQGKSMFANIVVPLIFFFLLSIARDEMDVGEWAVLAALSLMGIFTTSTAVVSIPMLLILGCGINYYYRRKLSIIPNILPGILVCSIFGLLYLIFR